MSEDNDDDPYDPNAAAELFFAQQKAREEARSKLPTDDWIQAIMMMDATIPKLDDKDRASMSSSSSSPSELLSYRLVTTMPPLPLNDSNGMIVLNTAETFISTNKTAGNKGENKKIVALTPDEIEARRRIMEQLVQQLEEEIWPIRTSEKEMNAR